MSDKKFNSLEFMRKVGAPVGLLLILAGLVAPFFFAGTFLCTRNLQICLRSWRRLVRRCSILHAAQPQGLASETTLSSRTMQRSAVRRSGRHRFHRSVWLRPRLDCVKPSPALLSKFIQP